jgi:hypothetical protein
MLMQELHKSFGDTLSVRHTSQKYSKWTLLVQLNTILMHTEPPVFYNSWDMFACIMFQHNNMEKVLVIMPTKADRLYFPVLREMINQTLCGIDKIIEYTVLCYMLRQYFLICFDYLE